ncbi:MAG: hypothetical protein ABSD59_19100 [Terracidiphilus sp.]
MVRPRFKSGVALTAPLLFCCLSLVRPQDPAADPLNESGRVIVAGRPTPYLIRHLPVNAFPQLPPAIQDALTRRGCQIPQTYEAHQPENIVNASLERHGSSDWAVLCSVDGKVSLLVFFSSGGGPMVLATTAETDRLQAHGSTNVLGFNWAIDTASPETVHEAQLGMSRPPPRLDHDALADSIIDQKTIYRVYLKGAWTIVETRN